MNLRDLRSQLVVVVPVVMAALVGACGSTDRGSTFDPASTPGAGGDAGWNDGPSGVPDGDLFGGDGAFAGDSSSVDALAFDPPTITLTVDGVNPSTAKFTLRATKGGATFDVTPQSIQFDRPDLAKATAGVPVAVTASGAYGGTGTLHGVYGGQTATAKLDVVVAMKDVGLGVDPQAVAALGVAGLGQDPSVSSLLYPYDKTVFPLGLASPLLMWTAPNAGDVYRVHLEEKSFSYDGFFAATMPGQLRVAQATWDRITASNGGDPLTLTLSRWDSAKATAYSSATESWTIAPASLRGAIYYWTTSAGGHMSRIRPGTGAQPEVLNNGKCMGCHAVSADGTTLVAAVEQASAQRAWVSFDLPATSVRVDSGQFGGNVAVNPNGKYVVFGSLTLGLGDTATGKTVANSGLEGMPLDPNMNGFMTPAFSPDGKKLAAVEGAGSAFHALKNGKLVVMDFDESTQKFSNLVGLAPASSFPAGRQGISYPSFTPDSQWIALHAADYPTGCDAQGCGDTTQQYGSTWIQNISGQAPIKLDQLNDSSLNAADHDLSLEPTFNPVERGGYFWVVFTSMRDWGNKIVGTPNNGKKRLWVAAIDKAIGTVDPSHPAFFLEGQEEDTTNMRGFWALAQCVATPQAGAGGGACQAGFECCSGFCDKGTCIDTGVVACKGEGEACTADGDCCNSDAVRCSNGVCTPMVTK